ncbi:MAG: phosphoribosylformylglycinamidine cyclo-ligase [Myxococcales bacterium]|nr:phosphoribosylformylglycinamidine cyclo-ligase [Myxococcales bacterium]
MALTYKDAGVDISAGDALVERIKPAVKATHRPEVLANIGGFAGMCGLPAGYNEPVLVSGTDGVGTKLKTALATGRHEGIGVDLVAMCVNDVIVTGAEPLFFLDYFATARLDLDVASNVIEGIAKGCSESGCALIGGETAEMPGLYQPGEYDLAGFCVGVVERSDIRTGETLSAGDVLVGIESSGLHSNGHSLARKVLLEELALEYEATPDLLNGASVADVLLKPTLLYVSALRGLSKASIPWKSAAHITGGGLIENPPRMLQKNPALNISLDTKAWTVPPVFSLIATAGIETFEMRRTFNMGLGMLLVLSPEDADAALGELARLGYRASVVGELAPGSGEVRF